MTDETRLTTVETVQREGSWLFTVEDEYGADDEVILVPCEEGVRAWVNRCPHETQRLDRGFGAAIRNGEVVCPKHGSMFETCSGDCDNGEAAGTTLVSVEVVVEDGDVFLADEDFKFSHEGGIDAGGGDDGDGHTSAGNDPGDESPGSTSHLSF